MVKYLRLTVSKAIFMRKGPCENISLYFGSIDLDKREDVNTYRTLEVLGPEHEFSIVGEDLKPLPIADKVIKDFHGRIVNFVRQDRFTFGKEMQLHVLEFKPNKPFKSPRIFEETMHKAVLRIIDFLEKRYGACLLGTGMHPLLRLEETSIWPHRHREIYHAYGEIFNLKQHGWLNIQSFQLNLPYSSEEKAIQLHNLLTNVCAYIPAISASSPLYEGKLGEYVDNRLHFYMENQKEIPSITGSIIPEYIHSFRQYKDEIIGGYSRDLAKAGAHRCLLYKEWVNSRGVILRFERKAIEIRILDEQECIKSDVALSCFFRALLRGLLKEKPQLLPTETLVRDFQKVIKEGLNAKVSHPQGPTARHVCKHFLKIAYANAGEDEKEYLSIVQRRIEDGSLSELIRENLIKRTQKADFNEAIIDVYSKLLKSLRENSPFL
ncbi:MAG: glutamate-cysteine ligase family protein [Candidatus Bathyarchaeota archaeon]|nr:glutamate-cysteine ligase family protein [Candidatus Bathyarchaeota archaeon]